MKRLESSRIASGVGLVSLLAALLFVAGCAETFGEHISDHRNCIGAAQIEPEKVDLCIRNTNGHRDRIDICLRDEMILEHQIDALHECVENYVQRENH
jgi:hypothetical protein